jgi:hypothetical protein
VRPLRNPDRRSCGTRWYLVPFKQEQDTIFEQPSGEIARELLERAVLEAYRNGAISVGRLAEILDLSIDEALGFLKAHQISSAFRLWLHQEAAA